jgi:hypothetical protein
MKHILISAFVLAMVIIALPVLAQDSDIITLNDATPAIDVVIALPPDTTGTIALNLISAAVTLTDATNTTVFSAADNRLHALELNIAPNTGTHTLTVERLPGVSDAYVSIVSLPELPVPGNAALVQSDQLNFNQEVSLPLDSANPGDSVAVNIPVDTTGMISATFLGANATTQLVDSQGVVVAASYNGHIDGMNVVLDGGEYDFTMFANNLAENIVTGVRAIPVEESGYIPLEAAVENTVASTSANDCTASVIVSSVNLRSGPGTGYSILDYGYRDEVFPVGGINPEHNWIVIATESDSAWLSDGVARLNGACDGLTVFNVPLRDAQPAPVIVVTPEPQVIVQSAPSGSSSTQSFNSGSHEDDDHEDDDDGHEEEDDD